MVFTHFLEEKIKHYLKLVAQQQKKSRGIRLGGTGAETLIDNLKSFMAHYSSDNLETAVGGIDRGDCQRGEKQQVKNRERFSESFNFSGLLFFRSYISYKFIFIKITISSLILTGLTLQGEVGN